MDVKITILQVEVANLRPNPWNTNSVGAQNFEKLKGSIEKLGFFKPILARELDGGVFEILGGEHRWRAAMEQGISTVPVISVGKINDLVAKQMSLVDSGGNVGAAGAAATGRLGTMYGGGAAGKAVTGNVPTWTKVGAIYGARV